MGIDLVLFLQQLTVFLVFAFLFNKYFVSKIMSVVTTRQKKIDEALELSTQVKNEYSKIETKAKEEISKAQRESILIIEKTKVAASKEAEKIKEEASKEAQRIINNSRKQLEIEKGDLKDKIQEYIASAVKNSLTELSIKASKQDVEKSVSNAIDELKV